MEKAPYYIIQKDGHSYSFFDYRRLIFKKTETITILTLQIQYKRGHSFKPVRLILRTIEKTNVDEINGKL